MNTPPTGSTARRGLMAAGAVAAILMVTVSLLLRPIINQPSLMELIGEGVLQTMPTALFSLLLVAFGGWAKPLLVGGIAVAIAFVGMGLAQIDGGPANASTRRRRVTRILSLTVSIWLPVAIGAVLVTTYGAVQPMSSRELLSLCAVLLVDVGVYAVGVYVLYPLITSAALSTRVDTESTLSRRALLSRTAAGGVALVGSVVIARFAIGIRGGVIGRRDAVEPTPLTDVDDFYVVSKNIVDPDVDEGDWELELSGLVTTPLLLNLADLLARPQVEQQTTLTCISNHVGGDLIGNAVWSGVRTADLLLEAGLTGNVADIALYADDGYSESLPLSVLLDSRTILALRMNGEPLTRRHGYPARLVVPGKYGIKNVKWITRIEPRAGEFRGYWQQKGWTDDATIETMSRIDLPGSRTIFDRQPILCAGVAYAGSRGVATVELQINDGAWHTVDEVISVAPLSWVLWRSTWNPPDSGTFTIRVRATDADGNVQTDERRNPIPDGATGHHRIQIGIA